MPLSVLLTRPTAISWLYPEQQESFEPSTSKVCAASFRPSTLEDRRPHLGGRHAVFDRQHHRLKRVLAFGSHDLPAEETVRSVVRDQFDEPARVARRQCPGHLIEREQGHLDI